MKVVIGAYLRWIRPFLYPIAVRRKNTQLGAVLRSFDRRLRFGAGLRDFFSRAYERNYWGNEESGSGDGSTLSYTKALREELPKLLKTYGVRSLLDAPCGDFNWMSHVALHGIRYTGADIVPELVEANRTRYGGRGFDFRCLDLTADMLPAADLWICRDCFIHLPNRDILRILRKFAQSPIALVLLSTYPTTQFNTDTDVGGFRPVNLLLPPFNFPKPRVAISDYVSGHPERELALWAKSDLTEPLSHACDRSSEVHVASSGIHR